MEDCHIPSATRVSSGQKYWDVTGADADSVPQWEAATSITGASYNVYAAYAGNLKSSDGVKRTEDSICPSGWRLPYATGEYNDEYWKLLHDDYSYAVTYGCGNIEGMSMARKLPMKFFIHSFYYGDLVGLDKRVVGYTHDTSCSYPGGSFYGTTQWTAAKIRCVKR